jgi:hypothetical protein
MAYQHLSPVSGQVSQIGKVSGSELLGCAVTAPHAKYEKLYCLPLTTIKMDKVRSHTRTNGQRSTPTERRRNELVSLIALIFFFSVLSPLRSPFREPPS